MLQFVKTAKQKLLRLAVVLVVVAGGTWLAWDEPAPVLLFREFVWDRFVWLKPRAYDAGLKVRIVDIDEASLAAHGQWPWPRSRVARLIDALAQYKVKAVIFDVFFSEPDATSLNQVFAQLKRDLPGYVPPLAPDAIAKQPDNDALMAAAMARLPVVLGITINKSGQRVAGHKFQNLVKVKFERRKDQSYLPRHDEGVSSLPRLQQAAAANASLDMIVDPDGITPAGAHAVQDRPPQCGHACRLGRRRERGRSAARRVAPAGPELGDDRRSHSADRPARPDAALRQRLDR